MQKRVKTLHSRIKKMKKISGCLFWQPLDSFVRLELLCSFDGNFTEILEFLHKCESGLAGTGAGSFIALNNLRFSVLCELSVLNCDFLNKLFHDL